MRKRGHRTPAGGKLRFTLPEPPHELLALIVVGLPCVVGLAREPILDLLPRPFIIEAEVHQQVGGFEERPDKHITAIAPGRLQ
jgi:hypothetical protein